MKSLSLILALSLLNLGTALAFQNENKAMIQSQSEYSSNTFNESKSIRDSESMSCRGRRGNGPR